MRLHVIRHVPFEGPGLIADWARERGHTLTESFSLSEEYPPPGDVDLLVVMGGPMAADDHAGNPWLLAEKRYLSRAVREGALALGVCLGAQVLAEVVGGWVRRNGEPEIGWYPVSLTSAGREDPVFSAFPERLVVGHWHGDTFDLPVGVEPVAGSAATTNQAYSLMGGRVVGLQFHLEWTEDALRALIEACPGDLDKTGPYSASAAELITGCADAVPACREALFGLLDRMQALTEE